MKCFIIFILIFVTALSFSQEIEKIKIPKGVVYNYTDVSTVERAKRLIASELKGKGDSLCDKILIVGPTIWKRYIKNRTLNSIEGGNTTFVVDDRKLTGKMTQDVSDTKKVWQVLAEELKGKKIQ